MKVILDIAIVLKGKHVYKMLRKVILTDLFPIPGIRIEDPAWKDSKIPTSIVCNFTEKYYLVNFENVKLDSEQYCDQEVEMYKHHGWKPPNEWPR